MYLSSNVSYTVAVKIYRGCLLVRQSFFHDDSQNFTDVGGGVTGVRGFHASFRPTLDGLSLNMGTTFFLVLHFNR